MRLVRKKTGQSRGFAYVDYETESAAQEALRFDQTPLAEQPIAVALSQPKGKQSKTEPVLSFGRNKSALSLLPRQMSVKKESLPPPPSSRDHPMDTVVPTEKTGGRLSNDDFRKMLMTPKPSKE